MRKRGKFEENKPHKHLYRSAAWRHLREDQLQDEPFCRFCREEGRDGVVAEAVDHIVRHNGDLDLFHDPKNLQSLCFSCHNNTKQNMEKGKIVIRYGPDGWPLPM